VNAADLPSIYPKGTKKHAEVTEVVFQCEKKGHSNRCIQEIFSMDEIRDKKFTMDVGQMHVIEAIRGVLTSRGVYSFTYLVVLL